jgi:hypothetical protein
MDQEGKVSNHSSDMDQQEEVSSHKDQKEELSNESTATDQDVEVRNFISETRKMFAHTAEIEVVYTDDNYKAAEILDMYENWLSKDEYKFVGLDFEYCDPEYDGDYRIAVVQLSMNNHVLVYQWSRYDMSTSIFFLVF